MVFSSVLTAAEMEFSRTSLWSMVSMLDLLHYISKISVSQKWQCCYVNRLHSVQEWRLVFVYSEIV